MIGTNVERIKNRKVQRNNTSGYTGVSWHPGRGMWFARISFRGKTYNIGYFDELEQAVDARKKAEKMTFDEFLDSLKTAKTIAIDDRNTRAKVC